MPPLKLDKDVIDRIANNIHRGAYPGRACEIEGIAESTYYDYLRTAKLAIEANNGIVDQELIDSNVYVYLYTSTKKADAVLEATLATKMMDNAMASNNVVHQAIALERRYRDRWSPQIQVQDKNEALRIYKEILQEYKKPDISIVDVTPKQITSE